MRAEAHVSLASIEHHLALLEPKGDSRDEHYAEAMRNLDEADAIYDELTGKRAKRGKANSMKVRGFIKKSQKVSRFHVSELLSQVSCVLGRACTSAFTHVPAPSIVDSAACG